MPDQAQKSIPDPTQKITDFVYQVVILTLAIVAAGGLLGLFLLALSGKDVPQGLVALPSAAIGAMAGLLAPSPASSRPPQSG